MNDEIDAEERDYWEKEAQLRFLDLEASQARGDPPYLVAAAELRLRDANERLKGLQEIEDEPSAH